ncbi:MAG: DoxX family protein [Pirellulales bacterium]|nr:DoxX family protein [Pirellulales bacterium]
MLVLLRICIGWHFFYEGLWKLEQPHYSSAGFWQQAKGPLADHFLNLIPDRQGYERLNYDKLSARWTSQLQTMLKHYNLGDEQRAEAEKVLTTRKTQLQNYLAENREAIDDYFHELKRLEQASANPQLRDVPFQRKRIAEARQRTSATAAPWLAQVDALQHDLEQDLQGLLDKDQQAEGLPPEPFTWLSLIDSTVGPVNAIIGLLLMAGLFTRAAAVGGILFLLIIGLSQPEWPTIYPLAHPSAGHALLVNKEFVEMIALAVLATTGVGRWGGLDFFVYHLLVRPWTSRRKRDVSFA